MAMSSAMRWHSRALHLIDVENLACSALPTMGEVRKLMVRYAELVGIGSTDLVVIACSHKALLSVARGWPGARYRVRSGPDGADLELIDVLEREQLAERFGRILIASGDGRFGDSAAWLAETGCRVTVVSRPGNLAVRLRLAASDVICLGPASRNGRTRLCTTVHSSTAARPALAPTRERRSASLHQTHRTTR
jgi:hypothetical protein